MKFNFNIKKIQPLLEQLYLSGCMKIHFKVVFDSYR